MDSKEFDQILNRYLEGKAGEDEKELVEAWFDKIDSNNPDDLSDEKVSALGQNLWMKIHQQSLREPSEELEFSWAKIAASITFLIASSLLFMKEDIGSAPSQLYAHQKSLIEFENKSNQDQVVCLPDGSKVVVNPKSVIHYPSVFGSERQVYLKGIAFFDVVKDATHPFVVYTGDVITKVLGTSFLIEENNNSKTVAVSVKTGKVMVYTESRAKRDVSDINQGFILKPNQKVVYDQASETLTKKLVEEPVAVNNSLPLKFKYENAPVTEIINELESNYGIRFEYNATDLANCTLTTELSEENLYQRIEIICNALGLQYEIGSDAVEIKGKCR